jgi:penicillin-binding protein 1B
MAGRRQAWRRIVGRIFGGIAVLGLIALGYGSVKAWHFYRDLERQVEEKFSGRRWKLPSRIYSAPFTIYPGMDLAQVGFVERLDRLGYVEVVGPARQPGDYRWIEPGGLEVIFRGDGDVAADAPGRVTLDLIQNRIVDRIRDGAGAELPLAELAPEPIAGIYGDVWESRDLVSVAEVPSLLVQSILAAEDRRFFEHKGVDWRAVLRALWVNVRAGGVRQGGSTLTQQLMKNFFLSTERTVQRKVVELLMALIAEQRYGKLEILENYLNEIYLGQAGARGVFGIREGARFYFGKEPGDLSLGQVAMLAGLIQAPNRYSPYHSPERALRRRDIVLARMHRAEMITDADYNEAIAEEIGLRPATPAPRSAPYFVDFVRAELEETYPASALTQDGLQVYTTLDSQLQRSAETAVKDGLAELEKQYPSLKETEKGESSLEACLVAIQPQTGEIKAMVGGRKYSTTQFNRAAQAERQVGSLFKPVVYAAALAEERPLTGVRWLPTSRIDDVQFEWAYDSQTWKPANYADRYFGPVSVRDALERSLNAATARTAHEVGLPLILHTARRLGFDGKLPAVPAIVLGAGEATPLQVARVYATFANGGLRPTPLAARRVTTVGGDVLERRGVRLAPAIAPEVAFMVTHILRGVLDRGTGRSGQLPVPAAGKTGTTDGYRDAWFAGYTPDLVAVVWVGFDHGRALGLPGSRAALPIWTKFMKMAIAGRPVSVFRPPPGVMFARIDPTTGGLATPQCVEAIEEAFPADALPTAPCAVHSLTTAPWTAEGSYPRPRTPTSPPTPTRQRRWWLF